MTETRENHFVCRSSRYLLVCSCPEDCFSLHGLGDVSFHVSHKIPFEKYKCITEIIVIIVRQQRYAMIVVGRSDHWENIEEIL